MCQNIRKVFAPPQCLVNSYVLNSAPRLFLSALGTKTAINLKDPFSRFLHSATQNNSQLNRILDVNTNVVKDVILFKYENPRFFKILNIFAICQYLFWNYLAYFAFTTLKDAPVEAKNEELSWWRKINLGENKYRNTITIVSFLIGNHFYNYSIRIVVNFFDIF